MKFLSTGAASALLFLGACATTAIPEPQPLDISQVDFGTDESSYANDGECDDNRFYGAAMAGPPVSGEHVGKDASDCRAGMEAGNLTFEGHMRFTGVYDGVEFGDNSSEYAFDRECDDGRFAGVGVTSTPILDEDARADADDCYRAYKAGEIVFVSEDGARAQGFTGEHDGIDFGDNSSTWAFDAECDDPRFAGEGMTTTELLESDLGRDADDCYTAYVAGKITFVSEAMPVKTGFTGVHDGIDFGDNSSAWAFDEECDDPRFEGPGVADLLDDADSGRDADDCYKGFVSGTVTLGSGI